MQSDLPRTPSNREATNLALARHVSFASMFCSLVAIVVAVALDLTFLVPLMAGQRVYNPIREFISYQVDQQSGPIMTGVFLLLAVAAWSYAAAAYLAPARHTNRINLLATFLFGWGLFVGAAFRAVPNAELAVDHFLKGSARMHDVGVGFGFVPAMVAAFIDQRRIVFGGHPGFLLTKVSFGMILGGRSGPRSRCSSSKTSRASCSGSLSSASSSGSRPRRINSSGSAPKRRTARRRSWTIEHRDDGCHG